jgi:pilus assembly protein Flp/PilA
MSLGSTAAEVVPTAVRAGETADIAGRAERASSASSPGGVAVEPSGKTVIKKERLLNFLRSIISTLGRDDEGQGLAEYALILALIAIVAIVALIFLGTQVSGILSNVGNSV